MSLAACSPLLAPPRLSSSFSVVEKTEPRVSCVFNKCSSTELCPGPYSFPFKIRSHCKGMADLKLTDLCLQFGDERCVPPCLVSQYPCLMLLGTESRAFLTRAK